MLVKVEHLFQGSNPRFVVTNLDGGTQPLYEKIYCTQGEMENRIKEQQMDLFADHPRTLIRGIGGNPTSFGCSCRVWRKR